MKSNSIFKVIKRDGKLAPFIRGWNVWDLDENELTSNVKNAIRHAYELGKLHAKDELILAARNIQDSFFDEDWEY